MPRKRPSRFDPFNLDKKLPRPQLQVLRQRENFKLLLEKGIAFREDIIDYDLDDDALLRSSVEAPEAGSECAPYAKEV